jgi:hypothetical protein
VLLDRGQHLLAYAADLAILGPFTRAVGPNGRREGFPYF